MVLKLLAMTPEHRATSLLPHDTALFKCGQQLWPICEGRFGLSIAHPHATPLVAFGPSRGFCVDSGFEESIACPRGGAGDIFCRTCVGNAAKVTGNGDLYAGFFPSLTFGGILRGSLVSLPTAFRENPAGTTRGLYQENAVFGFGKRYNAADKTFARLGIT